MNLSNDLFVEVALNVIGFIASGSFMLVVYSMLNNRSTKELSLAKGAAATDFGQTTNIEFVAPRGKVEFVNLNTGSHKAVVHTANKTETADASSRFQRNRLEVIKQAKEMLIAGNGSADIRRDLPIAEAELNIINQQRNSWSRRGAANDQ